jgi:hypothetical protein
MVDQFGNEVEAGDVIVSCSTATGRMKVGRVYISPSGRVMMEHLTKTNSHARAKNTKSEAGTNFIILKKYDGSLTETMRHILGYSTDLG